jgi:hypothetical protein
MRPHWRATVTNDGCDFASFDRRRAVTLLDRFRSARELAHQPPPNRMRQQSHERWTTSGAV